MCDYCDCRSIPEIATLSNDHERIQAITATLRRLLAAGAADREEIDRLLRDLRVELDVHTRREEAGVYSVFRDVGLDFDYAGRFIGEHALAADLLDRAESERDRSAIDELLAHLDRHILDEESDVFPAARQLFSGADWAEVDRRLTAAGVG